MTAPVFAYDVAEKDIATLQADMRAGRVTAVELVQAYQDRIAAIDRAGPRLNSIIAVNPDALAAAAALDAERRAGHVRGPLHGIPILVKDNIETADPMPTTAGSLALAGNVTHRDAPAVARLRAAGAVILGKTNLSEWANIRSNFSISGWSAIGGLVKNPYVLDRSACGSSSGSGAAVAASLAAAALGTETNGSLVCPASLNGIVSIKPTVGLVSRTHVVPISHTQDTPGPMTRSVRDAALLLETMAGSDPADPATGTPDPGPDYGASLGGDVSLSGRRLGLIVPPDASPAGQLFAQALDKLKAAGAEILVIRDFRLPAGIGADEDLVLKTELKAGMARYLQSLPPNSSGEGPRTLADLIAFNRASPRELALFGQDMFEQADRTQGLDDPAYRTAVARMQASARKLLDDTLTANRLDALIQATDEPAFRVDFVKGDNDSSTAPAMPAMAGYPHLTVPMGLGYPHLTIPMGTVKGPAGWPCPSWGPAPWSEGRLLGLGAAAERLLPPRQPPQFIPSLETEGPAIEPYRAP